MRRDPPPPDGAAGVYLHFPFCAARCSYCDFPTVIGRDDRVAAYLDALEREVRCFQPEAPRHADTIYLGGGTPSRMTPGQVARLLAAVGDRFELSPDAEVTLEANPEGLDAERLAGYRDAGVTRLSVGVQTLDDGVLRASGRLHDAAGAAAALDEARRAGFRQLSVDLIAGLPGEPLERWGTTVEQVAAWGPDHVSVYLLETDKSSALARAVRRGSVRLDDDETLAAAYDGSVELLERAGLRLYEISNFARPGAESRHNRKYWTDAPYAGFGLGAHAYLAGARRSNRRDLSGYLDALAAGGDPIEWNEPWDPVRRVEEALILGLRLVEGVDLECLGERYGENLRARYADAWERGLAAGLIVEQGKRIRLTAGGRLRSNELFVELLGG